jgi:hypothetical protein
MTGVVVGVIGVLIGAALFMLGVASEGPASHSANAAGVIVIVLSFVIAARHRGASYGGHA